ncbi:DJ-1/PfpI family protein [Limosilactobacillus mucosae]|uniref:DJ-1/PfpI family protein n=1 Tax=Limosilactobacillus mucosae TaxID=97478 RepID=UPI00399106FB
MNFYFLLFERFETLDLFGPVEIFGRVANASLNYISLNGGVITSAQGTRILTQKAASLPANSALVIPGGRGTRPLVNDKEFLDGLAALCDSADYVLSICTGSALLAAAGILYEIKATSNKNAFDWVKGVGDAVWIRKARWVHDGRFYTSSGVSAGIDMALGFVADHYGRDAAKENARQAEYVWNDDPENDPFA